MPRTPRPVSPSRVPVGARSRAAQFDLLARRVLDRIHRRREELLERTGRAPEFHRSLGDLRRWPLGLPNPRWVVDWTVGQHCRRARAIRPPFDADEERALTDAVLVVLALEDA